MKKHLKKDHDKYFFNILRWLHLHRSVRHDSKEMKTIQEKIGKNISQFKLAYVDTKLVHIVPEHAGAFKYI